MRPEDGCQSGLPVSLETTPANAFGTDGAKSRQDVAPDMTAVRNEVDRRLARMTADQLREFLALVRNGESNALLKSLHESA